MMMKNPPHPGEILKADVIDELGLTVTQAAKALSISRAALSRVLNCHSSVSPDFAIRLEKAGISTARAWLALQSNYDLAKALEHPQPQVSLLVSARF